MRYLFLTFIVVASCKNPASTTQSSVKIANGIQTDTVKYPSVVLVKTDSPTNETCSGTFIGSGVVLTAAHCLAAKQTNGGTPIDNPRVIVGGANGRTIKVKSVYFQKWIGRANMGINGYDIAILSVPEGSAPQVTPIRKTPISVGNAFTIVGFGYLSNKRTSSEAEYNDELNLYYGQNQVLAVTEHYIFSVGESSSGGSSPPGVNSTTAPGDSGGPLFIGQTIGGSVSWGPPYGLNSDTFKKIETSRPSVAPAPATIENDALYQLKQLPNLSSIQKRVENGEHLNISVHMNLTSPLYVKWLKSLKDQGLNIQFEGDAP